MNKKIKIVYHNKEYKIKSFGGCMDLANSKEVVIQPGEFELIDLGVSMQLPKHYHALVIPRSSTYKHFNIIQANSVGFIDNDYNGQGDRWKFAAIASSYAIIPKNSRICQFMLTLDNNAPWWTKLADLFTKFKFKEVDVLHGKDRNGFGSTGTK